MFKYLPIKGLCSLMTIKVNFDLLLELERLLEDLQKIHEGGYLIV